MQRYLEEHRAEIEAMARGRVQFDLGEGEPTAQITRFDRIGKRTERLA